MECEGTKTQGAQQNGEALGFIDSAGEDDNRLAGFFVDCVDEVHVFVHVGDEEVLLFER